MKRFCDQCGTERTSLEARFCAKCGASLAETPGTSPKVQEPSAAAPSISSDAVLQDEIASRTNRGWVLASRIEGEAQMRRPKTFSFGWALFWALFLGVGVFVYLFWHWSKRDELIFIRVVDGEASVSGERYNPFNEYWAWASELESMPAKALAYGTPSAGVLVLIGLFVNTTLVAIVLGVLALAGAAFGVGVLLARR